MSVMKIGKLTVMLLCALLVPIAVLPGSARAETGYVSDVLIVGLRTGPGRGYKVIKYLKTNTPFKVLEELDGYMRVETEDGEEGWLQKQYISFKTPKPIVIAGLEKEIASLKSKIVGFEKERTSLQHKLESAEQGYSVRLKDLEQKSKEYREDAALKTGKLRQITKKYNSLVDRSKNVVELMEENVKLQKATNRLSKETARLLQENTRLLHTANLRWFLAGSGVFFIGLIFGKFSRKKKYY
ncbi:MAG: TIGR04211 family SH3 domain-containing protein [Desulfobacterales bacterium]|nr:TIGR04211 family SH3 domain-containing protein [Desulfobacterales bacterium]